MLKKLRLLILFLFLPYTSQADCVHVYENAIQYWNGYKWFCTATAASCSVASAWLWSQDDLISKTILTSFTVDSGLFVGVSQVMETKYKTMHELLLELNAAHSEKQRIHELHRKLERDISFDELFQLLSHANRLKIMCSGYFFEWTEGKLIKKIESGQLDELVKEKLRRRLRSPVVTGSDGLRIRRPPSLHLDD